MVEQRDMLEAETRSLQKVDDLEPACFEEGEPTPALPRCIAVRLVVIVEVEVEAEGD